MNFSVWMMNRIYVFRGLGNKNWFIEEITYNLFDEIKRITIYLKKIKSLREWDVILHYGTQCNTTSVKYPKTIGQRDCFLTKLSKLRNHQSSKLALKKEINEEEMDIYPKT